MQDGEMEKERTEKRTKGEREREREESKIEAGKVEVRRNENMETVKWKM